jgi:ankyrin repeat protein
LEPKATKGLMDRFTTLVWAVIGGGAVVAISIWPGDGLAQMGGLNVDRIGPSPIFSAAKVGDWQSVDFLLKGGINPNISESETGQTALVIAAKSRHFDIVETLLKFGAKPDIADDYGKTALSWAAQNGEFDVAKLLLDAKANPNHQSKEGMTPLMLAIKGSYANVVQLLLDQQPDFSIRDYTGRGPLDWSRAQRDRRIESMLRRAGATG